MKTAEQILSENVRMTINEDMDIMQTKVQYILNAMREYANQKQCMYCEKTVNYSDGIFTCADCSK